MRTKLSYYLNPREYRNIVTIKDKLLFNLKELNPRIYLFGSFSKGCYTPDSDYDFLVLIDYPNKSPREIQLKKFEVTRELYDIDDIKRDFDVKLYDKCRFEYLSTNTLGFEHYIVDDLINIADWR